MLPLLELNVLSRNDPVPAVLHINEDALAHTMRRIGRLSMMGKLYLTGQTNGTYLNTVI